MKNRGTCSPFAPAIPNPPQFCVEFDGHMQPIIWGDMDPPPARERKRAAKAKAWRLKSVSGWRRSSLSHHASDDDVRRRDNEYLDWLATERGWSDYEARVHVAEQREALEAAAAAGVDGLRHRLFWHGFRPVTICGYESLSRWAIAGTAAQIHVGTRGSTRISGWDKAAHSIVIAPGRAPSSYELDTLIEDALAAIQPLGALPLAA